MTEFQKILARAFQRGCMRKRLRFAHVNSVVKIGSCLGVTKKKYRAAPLGGV